MKKMFIFFLIMVLFFFTVDISYGQDELVKPLGCILGGLSVVPYLMPNLGISNLGFSIHYKLLPFGFTFLNGKYESSPSFYFINPYILSSTKKDFINYNSFKLELYGAFEYNFNEKLLFIGYSGNLLFPVRLEENVFISFIFEGSFLWNKATDDIPLIGGGIEFNFKVSSYSLIYIDILFKARPIDKSSNDMKFGLYIYWNFVVMLF